MTPSVFFLQLALFTMGNSAADALVNKRITKRQTLNSDFVFPDQIEIVSEESPVLNVREAPFMTYENHQRSFSRDDIMQWQLDDGHQYRTQFTLRRAKPFGETPARKPLSITGGSGMNSQNEMLLPQNGGRGSGEESDESPNSLTSHATCHTCVLPVQSSRRPVSGNSVAYTSTTPSYSSPRPPPTQSPSQSSYYLNENVNESNTTQSHVRNEKNVIQSVNTTGSTNHNISYYSPPKPSSSSAGSRYPIVNPIPQIRPMATPTITVSGSRNTARPIISTNTQSKTLMALNIDCTGAGRAANCRRPSGSYATKTFDQTHSTSVITTVGAERAKPVHLDPSPKRPQSSAGSGLYIGTSETYAFTSTFESNGPGVGEDDDFFLSFQDLVKYGKLYNRDLYNTPYKTVFRSSSSSSSQSSSSGSGRSSSSFTRNFPIFSSFSQAPGPYLGFQGGISGSPSSAGKNYFFKR